MSVDRTQRLNRNCFRDLLIRGIRCLSEPDVSEVGGVAMTEGDVGIRDRIAPPVLDCKAVVVVVVAVGTCEKLMS